MFGTQATEEIRVTACEAPRHYLTEADSHGSHYVSGFTLTAQGPGATLVRFDFSAEPPSGGLGGLLAKLFGRFGAKAVAKGIARDLDDVARAAEGGSESRPG